MRTRSTRLLMALRSPGALFLVGLATFLFGRFGFPPGPPSAHALGQTDANKDLAAYAAPAPMAPATPEKVTLSGGASASTSNPITGKCLRISCTVDSAYLVGTGSLTATADSNQLPSATPETVCLSGSQTKVAFYSAVAGSCYVAIRGQ